MSMVDTAATAPSGPRAAEPDDFGKPIPRYVHTRPDDFAQAEAYAPVLARIFVPHNYFWD